MDRLVLIVEDDPQTAGLMERVLRDEGLSVRTAGGMDEARSAIAEREPHVAVLDLVMPGVAGADLLDALRADGFTAPVVVVSAVNGIEQVAAELDAEYLPKPFDIEEFSALVRRVAREHR